MPDEKRPFRVLSIDGGGMRGIYTSAYLGALGQQYARTRKVAALDIGKGFNLIAGTSTGGIIACALAVGIPPEEIRDLYREHGSAIFPVKLPNRLGADLVKQLAKRPEYLKNGAKALETALHEKFGDQTLGELYKSRGIALAVPAVSMASHRSWVFKTPHLPNTLHRDDNYKVVDVCLATSAAPIYRSLAYIPNPDSGLGQVFADGGVWANNPILVGLIDALQMTECDDIIEIFSLGTCPRPEGERIPETEINRGILEWNFGGKAAALSIDAQEFAFHEMARLLAPHLKRICRIIRFPQGAVPAEIMRFLDLDETSEEAANALTSQAHEDLNLTLSKCANPEDRDGQMLDALFQWIPQKAQPKPMIRTL